MFRVGRGSGSSSHPTPAMGRDLQQIRLLRAWKSVHSTNWNIPGIFPGMGHPPVLWTTCSTTLMTKTFHLNPKNHLPCLHWPRNKQLRCKTEIFRGLSWLLPPWSHLQEWQLARLGLQPQESHSCLCSGVFTCPFLPPCPGATNTSFVVSCVLFRLSPLSFGAPHPQDSDHGCRSK